MENIWDSGLRKKSENQDKNCMPKFLKTTLIILIIIFIFFTALGAFLFVGKEKTAEKINWGVIFSQKNAEFFGLDWKAVYMEIFDDLGVKNLKINVAWDLIETEKGEYDFDDLDLQIKGAEGNGAEIIMVLGMNSSFLGCQIPAWARDLSDDEREEAALAALKEIVLRYQNSKTIKYWQVESEPFLYFEDCPKIRKDFLEREIMAVRAFDIIGSRKIMINDSGDNLFLFNSARMGDAVSAMIGRKVIFQKSKIAIQYPFTPIFYQKKSEIIKVIFNKETICGDILAESQCRAAVSDCNFGGQQELMDVERFLKNIEFAKKTGIDKVYFSGLEWWYWMKEKNNDSRVWDEAKSLIKE